MLSRLGSEDGSAVSDFVILVVPASLLCLPLLELFGVYQGAIVQEQTSYEIARFAALADITPERALEYKQLKDPMSRLSSSATGMQCSILVSTDLIKSISFWPDAVTVPIQSRATCEK